MAADVLSLVKYVQKTSQETDAAVIGSDFGSGLACTCAQLYPETFKSVVHMSAPHGTPSVFPLDFELATLNPPRKHYMTYYTTRAANDDMMKCTQGLHDFLRAYIHFKSADWNGTRGPGGDMPHHLDTSLYPKFKCFAELPHYYVMLKQDNMAQGVARAMPTPEEIKTLSNRWLPEEELAVYVEEFGRTGFQGGLNWYRAGRKVSDAKATITVPGSFIGGAGDWGVYQLPDSFESMPKSFSDWRGSHIVQGGGHWLPQEQPEAVNALLLDWLKTTA